MSEADSASDPLAWAGELRNAQARWIAQSLSGEGLQAVHDARRLLARAIQEQNETMIRVYSETCLMLLEGNKRQTKALLDAFPLILLPSFKDSDSHAA